jgi:hypothetical protein
MIGPLSPSSGRSIQGSEKSLRTLCRAFLSSARSLRVVGVGFLLLIVMLREFAGWFQKASHTTSQAFAAQKTFHQLGNMRSLNGLPYLLHDIALSRAIEVLLLGYPHVTALLQ